MKERRSLVTFLKRTSIKDPDEVSEGNKSYDISVLAQNFVKRDETIQKVKSYLGNVYRVFVRGYDEEDSELDK